MKTRKRFKSSSIAKRGVLLISIVIIVICIEVFVLLWQRAGSMHQKTASLDSPGITALASQVIAKCKATPYHPTCYDEEIPKLMDVISMENAFEVTKIVQEKDATYHYCHVLGHNLSAREVKKDPSQWKELVSRCPSGMCSNGCLHGGFQERFRGEFLSDKQIEEIKPDLKNLCEERDIWHPTGLEQASCYHSLGHLTMYITNADIRKSIALCNEMTIKEDGRNFSQLCFDGAFMQIFQPLEPEDFALVKGKQPTKEQVFNFCSEFMGAERGSCWSESWPLFRDELQKPEGLVSFCSKAEAAEQTRCYSAQIYVLTTQFNFDIKKITDFCNGLPMERRGLCFANAASRMLETDYRNIPKSVSLCTKAVEDSVKNECFEELVLYAGFNFHPNSKESLVLCNSLPSPWKDNCLSKHAVGKVRR